MRFLNVGEKHELDLAEGKPHGKKNAPNEGSENWKAFSSGMHSLVSNIFKGHHQQKMVNTGSTAFKEVGDDDRR